MADISDCWDEIIIDKMVSMPCNKSSTSILRRTVVAASVYFTTSYGVKEIKGSSLVKREHTKILKL